MNSVRSVCVVDDDAAVRSALARMLRVAGYEVQTFADADAFLEDDDRSRASCLILDVRMPGMDGIELHRLLIAHRINTPVIFLTAHGDVPMAVEAMRRGVIDFVEKPFDKEHLLERVRQAVQLDAVQREQSKSCDTIREQLGLLTAREREVLELLIDGHTPKQISERLGTSRHTVKHQRTSILKKMQAASEVELVKLVAAVRQAQPE